MPDEDPRWEQVSFTQPAARRHTQSFAWDACILDAGARHSECALLVAPGLRSVCSLS